ncbi:MAG TPA: SRPBCC family protein [Candidatus Saccharimonadales bacterium]|nr:SRPBCC family protein [Candidatus Saccharimonadales bacterium]
MAKAVVTANPGESVLHVERVFDAPRDKVFKAVTTKELVEKWWLGPGSKVRIEELDAREGGRWRYVQIAPDGSEFAFYGSYHEVTAPERVVQTFEFSGLPERGHVCMEKMELHDIEDGKTRLTVVSAFFSVEDRDGMIQSGMEDGMNHTYDALDNVLASIS